MSVIKTEIHINKVGYAAWKLLLSFIVLQSNTGGRSLSLKVVFWTCFLWQHGEKQEKKHILIFTKHSHAAVNKIRTAREVYVNIYVNDNFWWNHYWILQNSNINCRRNAEIEQCDCFLCCFLFVCFVFEDNQFWFDVISGLQNKKSWKGKTNSTKAEQRFQEHLTVRSLANRQLMWVKTSK